MTSKLQHRRREPAPGVFRIVLPLPFPGLDRVNGFLLADDDGPVLVDCGIYMPDDADDHGWDHLVAALAAVEVRPEDISRLFVTHTHIDHYGMAGRVVEASGCDVLMHPAADEELDAYREPEVRTKELRELFAEHGVDVAELDDLTRYENWRPFVAEIVEATEEVEDGHTLRIGGRTWKVVYTPGHARSHVCLWCPEESILLSGDHLLPAVTPHIDFRRGYDDPLGDFLDALKRVEELDPQLVLPGHGHPFADGGERARTVIRHHDRRLGAIVQVIRREPATAEEITAEIFGTDLLNFQHRLALGEALAHIAYLVRSGEIERVEHGGETFAYKKRSRGVRTVEE